MPQECEDCGEWEEDLIRCPHCGMLICAWCDHHTHSMPDDEPEPAEQPKGD